MLIAGAWMCSVETFGDGLGASASAASRANSPGPRPRSTSGGARRNAARAGPGGEAAGRGVHPGGEHAGHFLVGAVLQQPGEQQIPGLEQRQILLILHFTGREQPGGLQVEQGGRDDEEVADLIQVPAAGALGDVGDELVGDPGEGDLGDVELVLGDQREQEVEGALEHVEVNFETAGGMGCAVVVPGATAIQAVVHVHSHDGSGVPAARGVPTVRGVRMRVGRLCG